MVNGYRRSGGSDGLSKILTFAGIAFLVCHVAIARADCGAIPSPVLEALKTESGWSIVRAADLDAPQTELWKERFPSELCPGFTSADLFGEGTTSYGLVLKKRVSKEIYTKLVVLRAGASGLEKINVTPQLKSGPMVVWRTNPGTDYPDFNNPYRSVTLPHDGLFFQYLGSTQYLYYAATEQPFHEAITFDTTIPQSRMIPPAPTWKEGCTLPPSTVAQAIDKDWSIVQMKDLDAGQTKLWKQSAAGDCPGIVTADFFGEGKISYGVAIFKREAEKLHTKLIVVRPAHDGYQSFILSEDFGSGMNVVWPIAPGTYNQYGLSNPKVTISHTSLGYQYLGGSQLLYYVKPEQTFHEVLTFD